MVEPEYTNLPTAVKVQLEKANDAVKKLTTTEPPATEVQTAVVENVTDSVHPDTPTVVVDQTTVVTDVVASPDAGEWEHKYSALKGKFDARGLEVQRLTDIVGRADATVKSLNDLIGTLQGRLSDNPSNGERGQQDVSEQTTGAQPGSLDPDDFQGYGAEMGDMVELVNTLVNENKQLKAQVGNVEGRVERDAKEDFFSSLTKSLNNWKQINQEPRFLDWLKLPDEMSGIERMELLQNHFNTGDVARVSMVFKTWAKSVNYPITSGDNGGSLATQTQTETTVINPLLSQAVPDAMGSLTDGEANLEKPVTPMITRAQYQKAAVDAAQGKITVEDFTKLTQQFQKLIGEGKIT